MKKFSLPVSQVVFRSRKQHEVIRDLVIVFSCVSIFLLLQMLFFPQPNITLGFNTNLYTDQKHPHDLSLESFKRDVDLLVEHDMDMVRFTIRPKEVVKGISNNTLLWNEERLSIYDDAILYASERGLSLYLVSSIPDEARSMSFSDYKQIAKEYFTTLVKRYQGKIYILQPFNETNIHHYRDYSPVVADTPYLNDLAEITAEISAEVKAIDPTIQVTLNAGGWPLTATTIREWQIFYDRLASEIDILSLDLYPDDNKQMIRSFQTIISRFRNRYAKPVIIAEIGLPTADRFTEKEQSAYLSLAVTQLKRAGVIGILPYQIRDEIRNSNPGEASMGIIKANGIPKSSFMDVLSAMTNTVLF